MRKSSQAVEEFKSKFDDLFDDDNVNEEVIELSHSLSDRDIKYLEDMYNRHYDADDPEFSMSIKSLGKNKYRVKISPHEVADSVIKDSIYRVYYPVKGDDKLHIEEFVGTEEEARNSAYDFAMNFPREKVIVQKLIGDSFDINVGDIYNDGEYEGKVAEVNSDNIIIESQDEDGEVINIQIPIEDSDGAVPDAEWNEMTSRLWNGEKIVKPDHWSEDDWNEFLVAIEDFDLSDDNPEGTILKYDGHTAWFETPGLDTPDDDYYEGIEDSAIKDSDELQDYYDATNSTEYVDAVFEAVVPGKYKEKCFFDGDSEGFVVTLSEPLTSDEASYLKEASIELPLEALNGAKVFAVQVQPINFDYVGDSKIKDGAERYVEDFNIDEIIDQGSTTVLCPLDEVDPEDIEFQIEQGLRSMAGENVEIPELGTEVLDTNTVVVYVL